MNLKARGDSEADCHSEGRACHTSTSDLDIKASYVRCLLILADIKDIDAKLRNGAERLEYLRLLRQMLVVLGNFSKFANEARQHIGAERNIDNLMTSIDEQRSQATWLRNKVGGHIDLKIAQKIVDIDSSLFAEHTSRKARMEIAQTRLLQCAVNHLGADTERPTCIVDKKVDMAEDDDTNIVVKWMERTVVAAIDITERIIDALDSKIKES